VLIAGLHFYVYVFPILYLGISNFGGCGNDNL